MMMVLEKFFLRGLLTLDLLHQVTVHLMIIPSQRRLRIDSATDIHLPRTACWCNGENAILINLSLMDRPWMHEYDHRDGFLKQKFSGGSCEIIKKRAIKLILHSRTELSERGVLLDSGRGAVSKCRDECDSNLHTPER